MLAIYKKEMRSYFINPIGYVFAGVFFIISALLCCYTTIVSSSYDTSTYFMLMIFAFVILIPLLTMRLFAEERKLRTEQLLMTAPVSITSMVMGKFLAALTLFGSSLLVSCINFIPIYAFASIERGSESYNTTHIGPVTGQVIGCLVGILLIGAAFIAIGTFISALTENQLAAAVITISVILGMVLLSFLNTLIDNYVIRFVIDWFSVLSRFNTFSYGLFDFSALLYYLSLTFVFLFLTVRVYEKRRWG
ncbi:MAG: ABC transporter permease [Clostridia bacterium]|nr:ABC transporter permease [Clostridia bacterium]